MKPETKNIRDVHEENISFLEFREFMFETIVPVKELFDRKGKPLEKILAFWRRKGLTPFIGHGKWIKISFAQLIWLRILDDLREISFPVEKMKLICDYFFKDADRDNLASKNLKSNMEEIKKKKAAGTQSEEDEQYLSQIESFLKDPNMLYILKFDINYLANLITRVISSGNDGFIYIFFDGKAVEYVGQEYKGHGDSKKIDFNKPHVCLPISHYLKEFINDEELSKLLMPRLLNEDEIKVLKEMRRNNIKEITIRRAGDKKGTRIESTKEGLLSKEQAKQIKELLGMKNYERITIDTMDEKTLSFKRTRKKI
jgi:hypothetical protein